MDKSAVDETPVGVIGHPPPAVNNPKPPSFAQYFWSPFSYVLYLWYGPILSLVGLQHTFAQCT